MSLKLSSLRQTNSSLFTSNVKPFKTDKKAMDGKSVVTTGAELDITATLNGRRM
jgi:hypothetical protein